MLISKEKCGQFSEQQLIQKSLENVDFFACIYFRYESRLLKYVKNISGVSTEEAEDILQEAFLKIWKNLNAIDPSLKLSSWIFRIVHNQTISDWRKRNTNVELYISPGDKIFDLITDDLDEPQLKDIEIGNLKEAIKNLPSKHKSVIFLKYFENMSYEEISDILKIPEGTVAIRLNRGKKQLKNYLSNLRTENFGYG